MNPFRRKSNTPTALSLNPHGTDEPFDEFACSYLTERVNLNPANGEPPIQRGIVTYFVWAKHAEDAIARLREQEPAEHPIVEIAGVQATGKEARFVVWPREWLGDSESVDDGDGADEGSN